MKVKPNEIIPPNKRPKTVSNGEQFSKIAGMKDRWVFYFLMGMERAKKQKEEV